MGSKTRRARPRDLEWWLLVLLLGGVLALGIASAFVPRIRQVPLLFFGLLALVVVLSLYAAKQRRSLSRARAEAEHQTLLAERNEQLAFHDALTGLFNRHYLEQVLPKEASRAARAGSPLSLLMIDVDGLREINNRFGHPSGDGFLVEVAGILHAVFREADTVVRYGGDEFVVVLPDTTLERAGRAVQRLLEKIDQWNAAEHQGMHMSLSCGVARHHPGRSVGETITAADKQMYSSKGKVRHVGGQGQATIRPRAGPPPREPPPPGRKPGTM